MRVLVVDDVHDTTDSLVRSLKNAGHDATPAYSEKAAHELLQQNTFDVVVTDMLMEKDDSGLSVLKEAKKLDPHVEVILLTAYAEVQTAVPAMNLGAFDYIKKTPEIYDRILDKVDRALIIRTLCDAFDTSEIAILCLFLGFDYDELPRESKRDKMVHMINQLSQDNELHLLEALVKEIRPDLLGNNDCETNVMGIMHRVIRRTVEHNPNIVSEVYSEMLGASNGENRLGLTELCQTTLNKSLKPIGEHGQQNPNLPVSQHGAEAHNAYDKNKLNGALVPARYTFLQVDIADHSRIVRENKTELVDETFNRFESFVENEVEMRGGKIWSWQGDGGLCGFESSDCEDRATLSATSILIGMQMFNIEQNMLPDNLDVCIAAHAGYVKVAGNKGSIHSEVINFVSNLEERAVEKNTVCVSTDVFGELSEQIKKRFLLKGNFEGKEIYIYAD